MIGRQLAVIQRSGVARIDLPRLAQAKALWHQISYLVRGTFGVARCVVSVGAILRLLTMNFQPPFTVVIVRIKNRLTWRGLLFRFGGLGLKLSPAHLRPRPWVNPIALFSISFNEVHCHRVCIFNRVRLGNIGTVEPPFALLLMLKTPLLPSLA